MNKYLKYALMSLAVAMVFVAGSAFAEGAAEVAAAVAAAAGAGGGGAGAGSGNVFSTILARMLTTFRNARSVIFVVGGFGLIGLGFAAIFGKVNWKWLAALACGLAIVAVAGQVVDYVTRSDVGQNTAEALGSSYGDTLTSGDGGYSNTRSAGFKEADLYGN